MALFGKKKDEEYEDDPAYTEGSEGRGNFSKRKFRDLTPENKKKRKEPPKPWGKKERMIVLVALLASAIISAVLILSSSRKRVGLNVPKIKFPSLNIFQEQTIIVEKK
jgi:hypothetical protein